MRNNLMISAAVAALLFGVGAASAQLEQRKPPAAGQDMPAAAQQMNESSGTELKGKRDAQSKPDAQIKADQKLKSQADQKLEAQPSGKAGTEVETTGQAGGKTEIKKESGKPQAAPSESGAAGSSKAGTSEQGSGSADTSAQGKTESGKSGAATTGSAATSGSVSLSVEQKAKIRASVLQGSGAPRVSNVNFSLTVGTVIPRTVRLVPVPVVLVEIYPAWRGYLFFIVGDQIVIVEPDTLRIVAVIAV